jgi:predicted ATPase
MSAQLNKLTVKGFKSIRELVDFELRQLNVLIGGNGAGKSNFVEIFRMLRAMMDENFTNYILTKGGADGFLFNGPKTTKQIECKFNFGLNAYSFILESASNERFLIKEERQYYSDRSGRTIGNNNFESKCKSKKDEKAVTSNFSGVGYYVYNAISNWVVYHFHDTSSTAPMRRSEIIQDNTMLRPDGANIAPYLMGLRDHQSHDSKRAWTSLIEAIRLVTPFFDDFILQPVKMGEAEKVNLSWRQKGSDYPMQPYHFSDGTIRFICLATALLQPDPPSTIVIDEPELGLHPYAVEILAELIKAAAKRTQVIISTQSPALVDCFEPDDIIVCSRAAGASVFGRLNRDELKNWLEEYSVGELWRKNVIAGGPSHE